MFNAPLLDEHTRAIHGPRLMNIITNTWTDDQREQVGVGRAGAGQTEKDGTEETQFDQDEQNKQQSLSKLIPKHRK